ncbi:hypothetical protein [Microvirga massiliensis]|uniref:hypothetical protein n=1 Tax=Microvirga massiliensis TaxID=1033741 RepID=UPI00062B4A8F|nr:hypothetical protein [Microvirga massiliensis]
MSDPRKDSYVRLKAEALQADVRRRRSYRHKDLDNRRMAKMLLQKLLPQAMETAKEVSSDALETSALGGNTMKWLRLSQCTGVHVYQDAKGGWFADLTFAGLPAGVPDIIGTPVSLPKATREEALQEGIELLALVIAHERKPQETPDEPIAVFDFDKIALQIPSALIQQLNESGLEKLGHAHAMKRLDEIRTQMTGGEPFTAENFDRLSRKITSPSSLLPPWPSRTASCAGPSRKRLCPDPRRVTSSRSPRGVGFAR